MRTFFPAAFAAVVLLSPPAGLAADGIKSLSYLSQQKAAEASEDAAKAQSTKAATSTSSKATKVRSQAEKRLDQQRKDLIRNWGG